MLTKNFLISKYLFAINISIFYERLQFKKINISEGSNFLSAKQVDFFVNFFLIMNPNEVRVLQYIEDKEKMTSVFCIFTVSIRKDQGKLLN